MKEEVVKMDSRIHSNICTTSLEEKRYFAPHIHREIEMCYAIEGEKIQKIGTHTYHSKPGDLLLMNSNEVHEIETLGYNKSLVILLDYDYVLDYCPYLNNIYFDLNKNLESKRKISEICEEIYNHSYLQDEVIPHYGSDGQTLQYKENYEYIWVKSKIDLMIYHLLKYHGVPKNVKDAKSLLKRENIDRIFHYIEANYARHITLNQIANDLGYSTFYLSKIFKEYTGVKLFDYLNQFRMEKSIEQLKYTNQSIKEIAEKNGFSSYKNFQTLFKKSYNMSPTEYRNKKAIQ